MAISREEVKHIAMLARVGMTEADLGKFSQQLSDILEHFKVLQEVDTTTVPPMSHSVQVENVMRPDENKPSFPQEDILANAPTREGDFFRVRAILGQ